MAQLTSNPERQASPIECIEGLERRLSKLALKIHDAPELADLLNCVQVLNAAVLHDLKNR